MSMFPFPTVTTRSSNLKKRENDTEKHQNRLAEHKRTLEEYRKYISEYSDKIADFDKKAIENQISIIQTALDLIYIKEQGNKTIELIEELKTLQQNKNQEYLDNLMAAIVDTNYKLEGLDQTVANRVTDMLLELQKQAVMQQRQAQFELSVSVDKLTGSVKRAKALSWFVLIFNLIGLTGIAFIILYLFDMIPFL